MFVAKTRPLSEVQNDITKQEMEQAMSELEINEIEQEQTVSDLEIRVEELERKYS